MKKNFGKATALIMGLLMILSGRALAFSSSNQELRRTEALAESKILIAQNGELSQEDYETISPLAYETISSLAVEASATIGDLLAKFNSVSESDLPGKNVLSQVFANLRTVIGDIELMSKTRPLTKGDRVALLEQAFNMVTTVGDICATMGNIAKTEEGRAVAECCVQGSSSLEGIALQFRSIAEAGL